MQPWDKDGRTARMRVALFDVGQPSRFARSHRAQPLRLETFRLFQYRAIPNQQPVLPLGLPLRDRLIGSLQEKLINLFGFPLLMVDEGAQPFRSSPFAKPVSVASQFREQ